jgi:hypothetical protein
MHRYGAERLLVLGPERDRHLMLSSMPAEITRSVSALLPGNSGDAPSPHEVLELVQGELERIHARDAAELLDNIAEHGVRGLQSCLTALQEGRLYRLVVPASLDAKVYVDPQTRYVSAKKHQAFQLSDDAPEQFDLSSSLPELGERWGAEVEFVSGEQERRVLEEFEGMGGLARW